MNPIFQIVCILFFRKKQYESCFLGKNNMNPIFKKNIVLNYG